MINHWPWWCHDVDPDHRRIPLTKGSKNFDIFFLISSNMLLNKQSGARWFETLWRLCDVTVMKYPYALTGAYRRTQSTTHFCDNGLTTVAITFVNHYNGVIMTTVASQITSLTVAYSSVYTFADQRKHQSSASLFGTGEFPAQRSSNAENVSIWWRHHLLRKLSTCIYINQSRILWRWNFTLTYSTVSKWRSVRRQIDAKSFP